MVRTPQETRIRFLVFIRNRLISGKLEPVLIHTKKISSSIALHPVFYEYKNVQSKDYIPGKLFIIRCEQKKTIPRYKNFIVTIELLLKISLPVGNSYYTSSFHYSIQCNFNLNNSHLKNERYFNSD